MMVVVVVVGQHSLPAIPSVDAAQDQIPVRLPVLGGHHHIDNRVDAGGQVDQQIAQNVDNLNAGH